MKKALVLSLLFFSAIAFSQVKEIKGQVLDAEYNNEPLAFANVKVQGMDLETITDENGNYHLELAPGSYNLEIGFIGYETRSVPAEIKVSSNLTQLDPVTLQSQRLDDDYGLSPSDNSTASRKD